MNELEFLKYHINISLLQKQLDINDKIGQFLDLIELNQYGTKSSQQCGIHLYIVLHESLAILKEILETKYPPEVYPFLFDKGSPYDLYEKFRTPELEEKVNAETSLQNEKVIK